MCVCVCAHSPTSNSDLLTTFLVAKIHTGLGSDILGRGSDFVSKVKPSDLAKATLLLVSCTPSPHTHLVLMSMSRVSFEAFKVNITNLKPPNLGALILKTFNTLKFCSLVKSLFWVVPATSWGSSSWCVSTSWSPHLGAPVVSICDLV